MGATFIPERELAARLGITGPSLADQRKRGKVPEHHVCECGRTVLYKDDEALNRWVADRPRRSAA